MAGTPVAHVLCLFLFLFPFSLIAQNITWPDSLSFPDKTKWVSASGEFAFGFRPLPGDVFLVGIWFNKIPEQTLVWVANRKSNPVVQRGSTVELTQDGRLVLKDPQGNELWQEKSENSTVASAALLNIGNFVLQNSNFDFEWESFKNPTDTILPSQNLDQGQSLSSNLTETDYSIGRFELRMQIDGNLVLYPIARPTTFAYESYWATGTFEGAAGVGNRLVLDQSGAMYVELTSGGLFNLSQSIGGREDLYHRVTLDYDGVLTKHVYPKTEETRKTWGERWTPVWSKPNDACAVGRGRVGSGPCGFNGYCRLENNKASCYCPPEYSYLDDKYKFKGCKPNFAVQDCQQQASSQYRFEEMINTDWPFSDAQRFDPIDEEGSCRRLCVEDCFCAVAVYRGSSCWIKKLPLSNGYTSPDIGGKALIKVVTQSTDNSSSSSQERGGGGEGKDNGTLILIVSILLSSSVFFNFFLLLAIVFLVLIPRYKKLQKMDSNPWKLGMNIRTFTYKELEEATNGFKEELGRGAFGIVYKGIVAMESRTPVAVKKLDRLTRDGEKEFKAEVSTIGQTHHKNLVKLLGFCDKGLHKLLVYEFMSNGSLASFLFQTPRPSWNQRIQIAFGVARGLMYLHEECSTQIIHCDIKPQNILLDDFFVAKISDFGLAKLLNSDQTRTNTAIRGTKGYVAPEWYRNRAVTAKVDVYSYGVLLLEIITCRRSIEHDKWDEDGAILTDWAYDCFNEGKLDMLVANDEEAMNDRRELEKMVMVALWCIQEEPSMRPSMKNVIEMLGGATQVVAPPSPSSFSMIH